MSKYHLVRAIAHMGGHGGSGTHRRLNLLCRRFRVADANHDTFGDSVLNVARGLRPFRRYRYEPDVAFRGILETSKLLHVRSADPLLGMSTARTIVRRNVRAL